jgi:RND family efflux transporter MFP subunit
MSEKQHEAIGLSELHLSDQGHAQRDRVLRRGSIVAAVFLLVLVIGALITLVTRVLHARELEKSTQNNARINVMTINPRSGEGAPQLRLPGTLLGANESPIYARSSGYVLHWYKDIGARVTKGELLAEIDTPEIDQQLSQAQAARQQASASLELAKTSYERWVGLRKKDAVSAQELDERHSAYDQGVANLSASEANVKRLQELEGFKRVVAPFAGIVTHRNVEVGDLIDAGNGGAAREMFTLSQTDPLRLYVFVPQSYMTQIKVGETVNVTLSELPGKTFAATIARTSGAIDVATRTLQVELSLPNKDGTLLPGSYVEVALPGSKVQSFIVPSNALLFRAEGPRMAVVGADNHVHLAPVTIGRELGQSLEITSGVDAHDAIIINPPDSINDGDVVTVQTQAAPATPATPPKAPA